MDILQLHHKFDQLEQTRRSQVFTSPLYQEIKTFALWHAEQETEKKIENLETELSETNDELDDLQTKLDDIKKIIE